jgi:hypothetical protein
LKELGVSDPFAKEEAPRPGSGKKTPMKESKDLQQINEEDEQSNSSGDERSNRIQTNKQEKLQ